MIIKSLTESITDVDTATRTVKGYFSVFGNMDADKDIIMPGAYKKTIAEHKRIKHLYQHNPSYLLSSVRSGKLKLYEDSKGLVFESQISDTSWGRDVITMYADGIVDEHSVGIEVTQKQKKANYREILEVKLWEGSTVTWGSNELAGMKSDKLMKALRNGRYENEEIFDLIEIYLKQLQGAVVSTPTPEPSSLDTWGEAISQFTKSLKP